MSNIGKQRILLPKDIKLETAGWLLRVKGRCGQSQILFPEYTNIILEKKYVSFTSPLLNSASYGSFQRKLESIIRGISRKYVQKLLLVGVGYKAEVEDNFIIIHLGFSHEIKVKIPDDLDVSVVKKRRNIIVSGTNIENIIAFCHRLRSYRRPEPFKGKGVVIQNENIRRKEGKKKKI